MQKNKGIMIIILTIVLAAFVAFVIIMQHKFMNPEFATAETNQQEESNSKKETEDKKVEKTESREDEDEEDEIVSPQYVTAELLNVRSGPGADTDIVGVVTLNQEVEVENTADSNGWVQISTDDFTGYVNVKYLSEEEQS